MQPIHELLNRIRWDREYGKARFTIGYYDRLEMKIIYVSFNELRFEEGNHFSFLVFDDEGGLHNVPYHRVKELYKDGELIWHREH